jgi:uncharacterized membrane protein YhaH (DUF805 family)
MFEKCQDPKKYLGSILFVLMLTDSYPGENQYGQNPKEMTF